MPRQSFKSPIKKHQIGFAQTLDDRLINYCEQNSVDLRQLVTVAVTKEINLLDPIKDHEALNQ